MIKFSATTERGKLLGMILEPGNLERLQADRPIVVNLREFDQELPELELLIAYSAKSHDTVELSMRAAGLITSDTIVHRDASGKDVRR